MLTLVISLLKSKARVILKDININYKRKRDYFLGSIIVIKTFTNMFKRVS